MTRKYYEILFILRPLQEEQLGKVIENYRSMVTRDGDIHRFENCGLRPFAYMIENIRRGYYILMNIECSVEVVQKIEKALRADENVLRFLLIVTKKRVSGASPLNKGAQEFTLSRRGEEENKSAELNKSVESKTENVQEAANDGDEKEMDSPDSANEEESTNLKNETKNLEENQSAETENMEVAVSEGNEKEVTDSPDTANEDESAHSENVAENPEKKE